MGTGVEAGIGDAVASIDDKGEEDATGSERAGEGDGEGATEVFAFLVNDAERVLSVLFRLSVDDRATRSTGDALLLSEDEAVWPMSKAAGVFVVGLVSFFPQNENNRPVGFCAKAAGLGPSFSRILQPTGTTSSSITSFLPLTDLSQAVEPLLAI